MSPSDPTTPSPTSDPSTPDDPVLRWASKGSKSSLTSSSIWCLTRDHGGRGPRGCSWHVPTGTSYGGSGSTTRTPGNTGIGTGWRGVPGRPLRAPNPYSLLSGSGPSRTGRRLRSGEVVEADAVGTPVSVVRLGGSAGGPTLPDPLRCTQDRTIHPPAPGRHFYTTSDQGRRRLAEGWVDRWAGV